MMNKIVDEFGKEMIGSVKPLRTELWKIVSDYECKYIRADTILPPTIDRFIYENIQDGKFDDKTKQVARFTIAYLIKGCEYGLSGNNVEKEKNNWIDQLFHKLKKYPFDNVMEYLKVVTFNYDRVFEFYALKNIETYFPSASSKQAEEFIGNVCHMYGSLGALEEISFDAANEGKDRLNATYSKCNLMDYSGELLQWPAGTDFENIYFLGFGYDQENLKKLNLGGFTTAVKTGTGKVSITKPYSIEVLCPKCFEFCRDHIDV
jgi:hypothetical protein